MKKTITVMLTLLFVTLINAGAFSQNEYQPKPSFIKAYPLAIGFYKTTNLVFPYAIKSVDRGSQDVLAQTVKGVENILQVKAGKANFTETNLTVITADGKLYSYLLSYDNNPSVLNIEVAAAKEINSDALFSESKSNEKVIKTTAEKVFSRTRTLSGIKDKKYKINLSLQGLFIKDEIMYYQVKLKNRSNISYNIEQLRFFIHDQEKSKRTASQELEMKPLYSYNNSSTVQDNSEQMFVFALPKLTIPDKKYLEIQLMEKNGGRHLHLTLKNKQIMRTRIIQ